jgi:hypothetical protein
MKNCPMMRFGLCGAAGRRRAATDATDDVLAQAGPPTEVPDTTSQDACENMSYTEAARVWSG